MLNRIFAASLALAAIVAPAWAQTAPRLPSDAADEARYEACLQRAAREPADAFEDAQVWEAQGGAEAARHCAAVALLYNGQPEAAATRLEDLAEDMETQPPQLRAEILAQAGHAWLQGRNTDRAVAVFTAALDIAPSAELWIDRAEAYADATHYKEAITDLNRAIESAPRRADAFAFRAAAHRMLDQPDLAMKDAERAVALNPKLPEAWLERAILNWQRGDAAAARRDFREVLLLDPDGPAGETARANIERMELKLDGGPTPPARTR